MYLRKAKRGNGRVYLSIGENFRVDGKTRSRPSAEAVSEALRNMTGHRLDANVYHFDYRTDLTDALCSCAGIDLSRQVMTKSQMNKVMSAVKKPRS